MRLNILQMQLQKTKNRCEIIRLLHDIGYDRKHFPLSIHTRVANLMLKRCQITHFNINMDRFKPILSGDNLCFLCLQPSTYECQNCQLPYCSEDHYGVHFDAKNGICFPFRVLQRPGVRKV